MKNNNYIYLGILQIFVGVGAFISGIAMLLNTDGSLLGLTTEVLENTPFQSYLIPGLMLLAINGICNIIAAAFSFTDYPYAGCLGLMLGIILLVWMGIQVYVLGFNHIFQPLFIGIGIAEVLLSVTATGFILDKQV